MVTYLKQQNKLNQNYYLHNNNINKEQMIRLFSKNIQYFIKPVKSPIFSFSHRIKLVHILKTTAYASLPLYMYFKSSFFSGVPTKEEKKQEISEMAAPQSRFIENHQTIWERVKSVFAHILRFFQLIIIFFPPIITFPLKFFKFSQNLWLKMFVSSVERAGVVWIKAFQYLSHRRDVIGPEMAQSFNHLRENAPQHSFDETKKNFKRAYGKQINQIFDSFDQTPIASGSVSQVYKAIYRGKKVAVKVRHPDVENHIQRDVNIMFGISKFLSFFSKTYQIPVGEYSLKKTLIDQIDFNVEKDNLKIFNNHFLGNKDVKFPQAFQQQTRDSILIESFVEGVPVSHFQSNKHPLNAVIARLGCAAFFEMLMKNNFIHADCHGGNILVQITKHSSTFFSQIIDYIKQKYHQIQQNFAYMMMESQTLKDLYQSCHAEEKKIRTIVRQCAQKVHLNVIDVGMVIQLQEDDRLNFVHFIKSVIEGNSDKCASMIYKLSNNDGKKIIQGKFQEYKQQLKSLFSVLDKSSIFDIEGISLLIGMLNIIRDHNMKLDGEFATLITNIVVLESIAKEIDPTIQILKCAIPYFKFVQDPKKGELVTKPLVI